MVDSRWEQREEHIIRPAGETSLVERVSGYWLSLRWTCSWAVELLRLPMVLAVAVLALEGEFDGDALVVDEEEPLASEPREARSSRETRALPPALLGQNRLVSTSLRMSPGRDKLSLSWDKKTSEKEKGARPVTPERSRDEAGGALEVGANVNPGRDS
jgi:hypothetical protein